MEEVVMDEQIPFEDEIILEHGKSEGIFGGAPEELAELKKNNGNQLFKVKQYTSALSQYTQAIELCPETASYYGNRSACFMMMGKHTQALEDARISIQLDPSYLKGYTRIVKCAIALGDPVTAEQAAQKAEQIQAGSVANEMKQLERIKYIKNDAEKAYAAKDYRKVVYCMDRLLNECPNCERFKLVKAECLAFLGRYQEAQEISNDILHMNKGSAEAIYVRGLCLYYEENLDKAFSHFQQVLRLDPDHEKALISYKMSKKMKQIKEKGNEAFRSCKFQDAINIYTEALEIDELNKKTNAKLYVNRAVALSRLVKFKEAIADCTVALQLDDSYTKALYRRAKCHMDVEDYEEAVKDYEIICKREKTKEAKRLLQEAKLALKKSKRKDYYKILGVEKNANEEDIKKAYRKRALTFHPDRHANASEAEKKEQEKKFKEVGEAYTVLSDPKKKMRYDSGHDMEDFEGGMTDIDPSQMFHSFFGGAGGHGSSNYNFGGFPGGGGFTFQFG